MQGSVGTAVKKKKKYIFAHITIQVLKRLTLTFSNNVNFYFFNQRISALQ